MIDKQEFKALQEELEKKEEKREQGIILAHAIIKESKVIIYGLQRGEKPDLRKILTSVKDLPSMPLSGIETTAVQEYVEALAFYVYIFENRLITRRELGVDTELYLLGICDLTGELVRKAVKAGIENDQDQVKKITLFVEEIYGEFLRFTFRNSELRKKADSIRWNLQKLEHLCIDLKR